MFPALPLLLAIASDLPPCVPVQAERILARDVAAAVPGFSALPEDLVLGYTPVPGIQRTMSGSTLQTIAKNNGIVLNTVPNVCFMRSMKSIEAEEILEAMRNSWSGVEVRIEVRSWTPREMPQGKLVFPKTGLQLPRGTDPQAEAIWRGYVLYGNNQRFMISARARVVTRSTHIVANEDIAPGHPIREDQVRIEACDACTLDDRPIGSLDEVIGLVARGYIRSGATILKNQVNRPPEVSQGDVVSVDVTSGGAHLVFEGRAETSGIVGSAVMIKNLASGKDFRAQVTGRKKVSVQ